MWWCCIDRVHLRQRRQNGARLARRSKDSWRRRHRRIRRDIIFGTLTPEHKLRPEAMRGDYGLSVSTLREILSRLSADGLVIAEGRRRF